MAFPAISSRGAPPAAPPARSPRKRRTSNTTPPAPRVPASQRVRPSLRTRKRSVRRSPSGHGIAAPSTSSSPPITPQVSVEGGEGEAGYAAPGGRRASSSQASTIARSGAARVVLATDVLAGAAAERRQGLPVREQRSGGGGDRLDLALADRHLRHAVARKVGELRVGRHQGRPARREQAQQRRRGLAGGGVAEVDAEIGRRHRGIERRRDPEIRRRARDRRRRARGRGSRGRARARPLRPPADGPSEAPAAPSPRSPRRCA